jgi:site-specific DNA-methyltransferase (adenine-specific)
MAKTLEKPKAPRNHTLTLNSDERDFYSKKLLILQEVMSLQALLNKTIYQDMFDALKYLPNECVDLMIIDPPYNLTKLFNGHLFNKKTLDEYEIWFDLWLHQLTRLLKKTASLYICSDWQSSSAIHRTITKYFKVRNRITWEREKGRGAQMNWKNCLEDIWFCTISDHYTFNIEAVKLKRRVLAPYRDKNQQPKDWQHSDLGNYRITYPSNVWTDISIPFWSMPENTDHPTQKPEKLIAKLILASSKENDVVFDPFLGSGTTSVVAKKLNRHYIGIEAELEYCCLAEKRLALAEEHPSIQGYVEGCFYERNALHDRAK